MLPVPLARSMFLLAAAASSTLTLWCVWQEGGSRPLEATVEAGELLYVPHGWWHCVLNLDTSVAIACNVVSSCNLLSAIHYLTQVLPPPCPLTTSHRRCHPQPTRGLPHPLPTTSPRCCHPLAHSGPFPGLTASLFLLDHPSGPSLRPPFGALPLDHPSGPFP